MLCWPPEEDFGHKLFYGPLVREEDAKRSWGNIARESYTAFLWSFFRPITMDKIRPCL